MVGIQERISELLAHFRSVEDRSSALVCVPSDALLIIRLDGIKLSKRFLKDALRNEPFDEALARSTRSVYYLWRNWASAQFTPVVKAAMSISDEVSFVLNGEPDYFKGRVMKIATTFAGSLSGAMSLNFQPATRSSSAKRPSSKGKPRKAHPQVVAFDARPLVLTGAEELDQYFELRRLLAYRNTLAKQIRLHSVVPDRQLYDTGLKNDVVAMTTILAARHLLEKALAAPGPRLFSPNRERQLVDERVALKPTPGFSWSDHLETVRR